MDNELEEIIENAEDVSLDDILSEPTDYTEPPTENYNTAVTEEDYAPTPPILHMSEDTPDIQLDDILDSPMDEEAELEEIEEAELEEIEEVELEEIEEAELEEIEEAELEEIEEAELEEVEEAELEEIEEPLLNIEEVEEEKPLFTTEDLLFEDGGIFGDDVEVEVIQGLDYVEPEEEEAGVTEEIEEDTALELEEDGGTNIDLVTEPEFEEDVVPDKEVTVEYGGEDGRPYNEYETVGTKEWVDGSGGVLVIKHSEPVGEESQEDKPVDIQQVMSDYNNRVEAGGTFETYDGEIIEARNTAGTISLREIPIDALVFIGDESTYMRKGNLETYTLENKIATVGSLSPIHVVPLGNPIAYVRDEVTGEEIYELPIYDAYMVLDGRRRVEACANLQYDTMTALVDTTIPRELLDFYQAMINDSKQLTFSEKMGLVKHIRKVQPNIAPDLLESSVGFKVGELPKADYVDALKVDYPDIYSKLEREKITIEQAFKNIEKAITKAEKDAEKEGSPEGQDAEDALRDKQGGEEDLTELDRDVQKQDVSDRHILSASVRRTVESRDNSECQVCGYAHGIPERADNLKAHHMVAVQYGGSDDPNNLIMLCNNCHEEVHKYESGRQIYNESTFEASDEVKKIVVLGNILRKARAKGISYIRKNEPALAKKMDKGKITIGRALLKAGVDLNVEGDFEDNAPYKAFSKAVENLKFGGGLSGDLGTIEDGDLLEDTKPKEPEEEDLPKKEEPEMMVIE